MYDNLIMSNTPTPSFSSLNRQAVTVDSRPVTLNSRVGFRQSFKLYNILIFIFVGAAIIFVSDKFFGIPKSQMDNLVRYFGIILGILIILGLSEWLQFRTVNKKATINPRKGTFRIKNQDYALSDVVYARYDESLTRPRINTLTIGLNRRTNVRFLLSAPRFKANKRELATLRDVIPLTGIKPGSTDRASTAWHDTILPGQTDLVNILQMHYDRKSYRLPVMK